MGELEGFDKDFAEVAGISVPEAAVAPEPAPSPEPVPVPVVESAPAPAPVAAPVAEPTAPAPVVDEKDQIIASLRQQLNDGVKFGELEATPVASVSSVAPAPTQAPAPQPSPAPQAAEIVAEALDFIGAKSIDDAFASKESINELLNAVVAKAAERASAAASERAMRSIPEVVTKYVANVAVQQRLRTEFYDKHKDLVPYQRICAAAANHISAQHPDWDLAKILEAVPTMVRQNLGLMQKVTTINQGPAFAGGSGGRPSSTAPQLAGLEKEIADIIP